ncbi:MAG: hypothetical protein IKP46_07470 [Bacteroidales bacterium]|nr:hypothetical protein [Bacteroidales bacterium]
MKTRYFILPAFLLSAVLSCAREEVLQDETPAAPADLVTYTLKPAEGTRAAMDDNAVWSWSEGDEIAVYDANSGNVFTFKGEGSGEDFVFKASIAEGEYNWTRAWSPASLVGEGAITGSVTLPSEYDYADVADAGMVPLTATIHDDNTDDEIDGELFFTHMAAVMRLTVNGVPAEAGTLELSSADAVISGGFDLTTSGKFTAEGEDAGEGTPVEVKSGENYESPHFVDEIKAGSGAGSITVRYDFSEKTDMVVYLPVPTGTYNYKITLKNAGGYTLLEQATTSAKTFSRTTFKKMGALSITETPATNRRLRGNYIYNGTTYNFGTTNANSLAFEPVYNGWYKAEGLTLVDSGENRRIRFKFCTISSNKVGTHYAIATDGLQRSFVLGELIPVLSSGGGADANFYLQGYPDDATFTVYYNPTLNKTFMLESSQPFAVPEAEMSEADKASLLYLDGELCTTQALSVVSGQPQWRKVTGIPAGTSVLLKTTTDATITSAAAKKTLGAATAGPHATGALFEAGEEAFTVSEASDIYIKADASVLFALPAGSAFSEPTLYEGV